MRLRRVTGRYALNMDTESDDAQRFAACLGERVAPRGKGDKMPLSELVKELNRRGAAVSAPTVTRWLQGENCPSKGNAYVVGLVFNDPDGALAAAGFANVHGQLVKHTDATGDISVIVLSGDPIAQEKLDELGPDGFLRWLAGRNGADTPTSQ